MLPLPSASRLLPQIRPCPACPPASPAVPADPHSPATSRRLSALLRQSYDRWELCVAAAGPVRAATRPIRRRTGWALVSVGLWLASDGR